MPPRLVSVLEAAGVLGLPVSGVEALADAGYLRVDGEQLVPMSELKAFQARNNRDDDPAGLGADQDADAILDLLEGAVDDMARRAADITAAAFPAAARWSVAQRRRFQDQARARFEAIVALTRSDATDDELLEDLAEAGGAAAAAGASLPQVLLSLRVSRDLLVQSAVSAAEELGQLRSISLAVVLTRVLPVLDRLTDTVARGWWTAVQEQEARGIARLADDLHDVGRAHADALTLLLGPVDVAAACAAAVHLVPGAHAVDVDVPTPLSATADARRLQHVLAHLVENGLRHGRPPVVLHASSGADGVCISVTDHGDGVPDQLLEHLFAPADAGDDVRGRPARVSLSLACRLVEAMGGHLHHERAGGTTRFVVTLPA